MEDEDIRTALATLQSLLDAVNAGEVRATSPADVALKRRLEGAVVALRALLPEHDEAST